MLVRTSVQYTLVESQVPPVQDGNAMSRPRPFSRTVPERQNSRFLTTLQLRRFQDEGAQQPSGPLFVKPYRKDSQTVIAALRATLSDSARSRRRLMRRLLEHGLAARFTRCPRDINTLLRVRQTPHERNVARRTIPERLQRLQGRRRPTECPQDFSDT